MLYRNKETGRFYLLNDSDNYGFDCYSFTEKLKLDDGYIPFDASTYAGSEDEEEREKRLIKRWDEEMSEEEKINYCLEGMDTSLSECELIEDEELEEFLFERC